MYPGYRSHRQTVFKSIYLKEWNQDDSETQSSGKKLKINYKVQNIQKCTPLQIKTIRHPRWVTC